MIINTILMTMSECFYLAIDVMMWDWMGNLYTKVLPDDVGMNKILYRTFFLMQMIFKVVYHFNDSGGLYCKYLRHMGACLQF